MDNTIKYNSRATIKDLDISQRPRELLLQNKEQSLTDEQLLAILIDTGTKEHNAIEISKQLIDYVGGFENLIKCDIDMIRNIKGIGIAKACRIIASIEFANRLMKRRIKKNKSITSPQDLIDMFCVEFERQNVEIFKLICLNTKNNIIYSKNLTVGTANSSLINTRELYKEALLRHSVSIIIMHNHPSGNPMPSKKDIQITDKIRQAGDIMDIKLIDHIIYGNLKNYYSFKENGYI